MTATWLQTDDAATARSSGRDVVIVRADSATTRFGAQTVLDGIDLSVRRGEVFVIMGPSGCGKTTMLRHLCGLSRPSEGTVTIDGQDLYAATPAERRALRLRMGAVVPGRRAARQPQRRGERRAPAAARTPRCPARSCARSRA